MTRALTVSLLTVAATIAAALLGSPTARAGQGDLTAAPQLQQVESRIEAQVDARLHSILTGILEQNS